MSTTYRSDLIGQWWVDAALPSMQPSANFLDAYTAPSTAEPGMFVGVVDVWYGGERCETTVCPLSHVRRSVALRDSLRLMASMLARRS